MTSVVLHCLILTEDLTFCKYLVMVKGVILKALEAKVLYLPTEQVYSIDSSDFPTMKAIKSKQ